MSLITPPRLVEDPEWERAMLGPFVEDARKRLRARTPIDVQPTIERAHGSVPYYQDLFARRALGRRDLEDPRAWPMIPLTRRADLGASVERFFSLPLEPHALARGWLGRTSGSTGEPITYLRDPRTLAWFWAFVDFVLDYGGKPPFPRGGTIALLDAIEHMPEYDAFLPLLHDGRFAKRNRAAGLRAHVVTGDPESLAQLADVDLEDPPALVLSSAFAMSRALRDAIAKRTGAAVVEYYATQETSVIGVACRLGRGYHSVPGACFVEEVEGEIVVTPTNNPSFVLIRYAPGDHGAVRDVECACGLSGPTVVELAGRTDVRFAGRRGTFAAALTGPLLARLDVLEHQLVQCAPDRYRLRVRGGSLAPEALVPLRTRLAELAGGSIELTVERVERIARTTAKPQPFVVEHP